MADLNRTATKTLRDEDYFTSLNFWEQWEECVRCVVTEGNLEALPFMIVHLLWGGVQILVICGITHWCGGSELNGVNYWTLLAKNSILVCSLTATLGINGMYIGPMSGEPFFRQARYRFKPGTFKEPLLTCFRCKRGFLDLILVCATVLCCVMLLIKPNPTAAETTSYLVLVMMTLVFDYGSYIGSDGIFHLPLAVFMLLQFGIEDDSALAFLQLWLLLLYVGCGIGKTGPWFPGLFALEWTTPPWASGCKILRNLFYVNADDGDLRCTGFAKVFGYLAAVSEWLLPPLIFLTPEVLSWMGLQCLGLWPVYVGVALPVAMHVYIVFHLPLADVNMLNFLPGLLWVYSCYIASKGFSYGSFTEMSLGLKLSLLMFVVYVIVGQVRTDRVGYENAYRFWAGNWSQGFYLISDAALEKMKKNVVAFGDGIWLDDLRAKGMMPSWDCRAMCFRALAGLWISQLNSRIMPALMHRALGGRKLTDVAYIMPCIAVNQWVLGVVGGCALHSKHVMATLSEACQFEEGELVYVHTDSFSSLPWISVPHSTWRIEDAKAGVVASGRMTYQDCLEVYKPTKASEFNLTKHASAALGVPLL